MQKVLRLLMASVVLSAITGAGPPTAADASIATHVVISEVETGTSQSASQEFIELYNPTASDVSVDGWTLEYKSATSTDTASNWLKRGTLGGTIRAYGFYLVAPKGYLPIADADWSATLAGSGGNLRLRDSTGSVVDQLGYGATANAAEGGAPAAAPPSGQSLERLPGRLDELDGNGVDSDNNAADFVLRTVPLPQTTQSPIEVPGASDSDMATSSSDADQPPTATDTATDQSSDSDGAPTVQSYAPVDITELLVNPMTPLTDAHDEFIELYNPTDDSIDLTGYTLRTGSNFHDFYVIPSLQLASGGYVALYSSQTKLSLPNTGGAAEILDPSGAVADVTPAYPTAPEGQGWARFDDGWHWTLQLTPGQPNVLASAVTLAANTTAKAVKRTKTPKAATTAKKKAKAAKKPAAKRTKKPKATTAKSLPQLAAARSLQPALWLIIGLAALTIGYALYEFRYDIYNLYHYCCGNPAARREDRPTDSRRDRD